MKGSFVAPLTIGKLDIDKIPKSQLRQALVSLNMWLEADARDPAKDISVAWILFKRMTENLGHSIELKVGVTDASNGYGQIENWHAIYKEHRSYCHACRIDLKAGHEVMMHAKHFRDDEWVELFRARDNDVCAVICRLTVRYGIELKDGNIEWDHTSGMSRASRTKTLLKLNPDMEASQVPPPRPVEELLPSPMEWKLQQDAEAYLECQKCKRSINWLPTGDQVERSPRVKRGCRECFGDGMFGTKRKIPEVSPQLPITSIERDPIVTCRKCKNHMCLHPTEEHLRAKTMRMRASRFSIRCITCEVEQQSKRATP